MGNSASPPGDRLARLERQVFQLKVALGLLGAVVLIGTTAAFQQAPGGIIRTRGIIVEDQAGRERILIGAPIPIARNRLRTDTARVAASWARRFPDPAQYMKWYHDYRHSMHGMLVLDEQGIDRIAIGDSTPDPNIGRRIGPATGIQINDEQGFERSGYGMLRVDGRNRVVLGLDSRRGTEGVALSLFDEGPAGLFIYGPGRSLAFLGTAPANHSATGVADSVFGFLLRQGTEVRHLLSSGASK